MRTLILVAAFLLAQSVWAESGSLATPSQVDASTSEFMAQVAKGDVSGAYQGLRAYLGVPAEPYDASAREADEYFDRVAAQVGDTLSVSAARREAIGEDFYRVTWLQKFETAAMAWTFTFYQPRDGYRLVGVSYSTELADLYRPLPAAD